LTHATDYAAHQHNVLFDSTSYAACEAGKGRVIACTAARLLAPCYLTIGQNRTEKFMLSSDHNRSLPRRQPGAKTIDHSPKGKEKS